MLVSGDLEIECKEREVVRLDIKKTFFTERVVKC